ncbi:MAG: hypothetical protein WC455_08840 [Dehalococcoidia bacterium]
MSGRTGAAILMAAAVAMGIGDDGYNMPDDRTPPRPKKRDKKAKRKAKIATNSRKANRKK